MYPTSTTATYVPTSAPSEADPKLSSVALSQCGPEVERATWRWWPGASWGTLDPLRNGDVGSGVATSGLSALPQLVDTPPKNKETAELAAASGVFENL